MSAWIQGAQAHDKGLSRNQNPYNIDSEKGKEWFRGYDAASKRGPSLK